MIMIKKIMKKNRDIIIISLVNIIINTGKIILMKMKILIIMIMTILFLVIII